MDDTKALRSYAVGDVLDFVVGRNMSEVSKKLRLAYSGVHCQVWVDDKAKAARLAREKGTVLDKSYADALVTILGEGAYFGASSTPGEDDAEPPTVAEFGAQLGVEFDRLIFPQLTKLYGRFGEDNKGFAYILMYDFAGYQSHSLGVVYSDNLQDNTTTINISVKQSPRQAMATTAHEFTHSIASYYNKVCGGTRALPLWANEGLAEVSARLLYGDDLRRVERYLQLISKYDATAMLGGSTPVDADASNYFYGKAHMLMLYIVAEVSRLNGTTGFEALRAIMTSAQLQASGNNICDVIRSVARGCRWTSLDELLREMDSIVRYAVGL